MGYLFNKKERQMFADYYGICQKYWTIPNDTKAYWDELFQEAEKFNEKYKDIPLAWYLISDFMTAQEMKEWNERKEYERIDLRSDINAHRSHASE